MGKNLWILHHYGTPPTLTGLTRPYHFGKYLKLAGYPCTVFAASYQHYAGYNLIEDGRRFLENEEEGVPFIYVRTPGYHGSGLARIRNMVSFFFGVQRSAKIYAKKSGNPDVILASSPHPLACLAGFRLSKRYGCKCIVEIRDLWPEGFVAFGIINKRNPLLKLLYAGEKWLYKKADALIFTMEGGKDYIIEKGWDTAHGGPIDLNKVYHINNGVDLEAFDYNREHFTLEDPDLDDPGTFKIIYAGSIRYANGLNQLIQAANLLKDRTDICFLLYGDGNDYKNLKEICVKENIMNVHLKGRVEKKYIPYVLSKGNLSILNYRQVTIGKYGGSQNKLFEYLASGKPILSNLKINYSPIEQYKCGFVEETGTAEGYAQAILQFVNLPQEEYTQQCKNARKAALEYDFKRLTEKLIQVLDW